MVKTLISCHSIDHTIHYNIEVMVFIPHNNNIINIFNNTIPVSSIHNNIIALMIHQVNAMKEKVSISQENWFILLLTILISLLNEILLPLPLKIIFKGVMYPSTSCAKSCLLVATTMTPRVVEATKK